MDEIRLLREEEVKKFEKYLKEMERAPRDNFQISARYPQLYAVPLRAKSVFLRGTGLKGGCAGL